MCPTGYVFIPGDVPGRGLKSQIVRGLKECQALCDDDNRCLSFEWSPSTRRCNVNKESKPTDDAFRDYIFCRKGKSHSIVGCRRTFVKVTNLKTRRGIPFNKLTTPFIFECVMVLTKYLS